MCKVRVLTVKRGFIILLLFMASLAFACDAPEENEQINLNDPLKGDAILTAAELISFLEKGSGNIATLGASINLENDILRVGAARGEIAIHGNGYSLTGNGDCVIRLEDGCDLTLDSVHIVAGRNGIGTLGNATIGGNATITSVAHAIVSSGDIVLAEESDFQLVSNVGCGIQANGLTLMRGVRVVAQGKLGAIDVATDDLIIGEGARLEASTTENYNAIKCAGTLVMMDASHVIARNEGEYHGAELNDIEVHGVVTLEATGGLKGVGVFLFVHESDIRMLGFCTPDLRYEVGRGSITFVDDPSEVGAEPIMGGSENSGEDEDAQLP